MCTCRGEIRVEAEVENRVMLRMKALFFLKNLREVPSVQEIENTGMHVWGRKKDKGLLYR